MIRPLKSIVERLNIFTIKNEQLINFNLEYPVKDNQIHIKQG
tara:strand:+ start:1293 stop:1418 length:126 start_codon:yes stop_codon:yes gene_type:complete